MKYKIIISAGGTGGHIFPAVAVASALQELKPDTEILFVGAQGRMEMEKVPQSGYEIVGLDIQGFNRNHLWKNISLPWKLLNSFRNARSIIKEFQPDALVGFGGYASFPVLRTGQMMSKKTFIHESNAFAGKSNKLIGKRAQSIFTAFEDMSAFFDPRKTYNYGNPVRKSLYQNPPSREEAIGFFDLDPNQKVLSIVGGSLGARSINQFISSHITKLNKMGLQVIWQTGTDYYEQAMEETRGMVNFRVMAFLKEIQNLYKAADVIISRAGAMATAELEIMGRPVLFVPFPYAAEDHQRYNAQKLVDQNAASMVLDAEMSEKLLHEIQYLMNDDQLRKTYSKNIQKLAVYDADKKIAEKILTEING